MKQLNQFILFLMFITMVMTTISVFKVLATTLPAIQLMVK